MSVIQEKPELTHFGKKGMHWGQRAAQATTKRKVGAAVGGYATAQAVGFATHNPVVSIAAGVTAAVYILKFKGNAPVSSLKK